jgi:hypothetical protein
MVELFSRSLIRFDNMEFNYLSPGIIYNLKLSEEYFEVIIGQHRKISVDLHNYFCRKFMNKTDIFIRKKYWANKFMLKHSAF